MMMRWTVEERAAASEQQQDALRARSRRRRQRRQPIRHTPPPDNDAPLAKKITECILDNQDDAAQEERWRTTMKRETMKRFREQRAAIDQLEKAMLMKIDEKMDQLIKSIHSTALAVRVK